jgi:uncharacterized 2Fe-2S/4Fe-4S cluster protein (DUF4445 family)
VSLWLVDLVTGQVRAQVAEYNGQIARGEDVISRIMYTGKNGGGEEMRQRVLDTINSLLTGLQTREASCKAKSPRIKWSKRPLRATAR